MDGIEFVAQRMEAQQREILEAYIRRSESTEVRAEVAQIEASYAAALRRLAANHGDENAQRDALVALSKASGEQAVRDVSKEQKLAGGSAVSNLDLSVSINALEGGVNRHHTVHVLVPYPQQHGRAALGQTGDVQRVVGEELRRFADVLIQRLKTLGHSSSGGSGGKA